MDKTCGTCRFGKPAVLCPFGDNFYEYDETTENFTHGCWKERTDTIDQRYEQLEQVANKMQKCLAAHADDWTEVSQGTADYYADELEALGVSLDD